jgi:hypothetical protein
MMQNIVKYIDAQQFQPRFNQSVIHQSKLIRLVKDICREGKSTEYSKEKQRQNDI